MLQVHRMVVLLEMRMEAIEHSVDLPAFVQRLEELEDRVEQNVSYALGGFQTLVEDAFDSVEAHCLVLKAEMEALRGLRLRYERPVPAAQDSSPLRFSLYEDDLATKPHAELKARLRQELPSFPFEAAELAEARQVLFEEAGQVIAEELKHDWEHLIGMDEATCNIIAESHSSGELCSLASCSLWTRYVLVAWRRRRRAELRRRRRANQQDVESTVLDSAIANHDVASPLVELDAPAASAAPPQTSGVIGEPARAKVREEDVERAMARFTRLQSEQQSAKKSAKKSARSGGR